MMDDFVLERTSEQIKKLYQIDDRLSNILEKAGQDSETKYTPEYLELIEDLKALRNGLRALLRNHNCTINDLEYEVG